jgi:hypothetical protein
MNTVSRTISGVGAIIIGAGLTIWALVEAPVLLFYGLPTLVVGFFILFNKKEDTIEQIKNKDSKKEQ